MKAHLNNTANSQAYDQYLTPVGKITITANDNGIVSVSFSEREKGEASMATSNSYTSTKEAFRHIQKAVNALDHYFAGDMSHLKQVKVSLDGTEFQKRVWTEMRKVPAGEVRSYGEIAAAVSCPGASRAVGTACRRNRIALFIPCHRIVAARNRLGGYNAGLERKRFLLNHEQFYS